MIGFLVTIGSVKGKVNARDGALGRGLCHMAGTGWREALAFCSAELLHWCWPELETTERGDSS